MLELEPVLLRDTLSPCLVVLTGAVESAVKAFAHLAWVLRSLCFATPFTCVWRPQVAKLRVLCVPPCLAQSPAHYQGQIRIYLLVR